MDNNNVNKCESDWDLPLTDRPHLKSQIEAKIGRAIPETVWLSGERKEYTQEIVEIWRKDGGGTGDGEDQKSAVTDLLGDIKRDLAIFDAGKKEGGGLPATVQHRPYSPPENEDAIHSTITNYYRKEIGKLPEVKAFRNRLLIGLMPADWMPDSYHEFLQIDLIRLVDFKTLNSLNINLIEHKWKIIADKDPAIFHYEVLLLDGKRIAVQHDRDSVVMMQYDAMPDYWRVVGSGIDSSRQNLRFRKKLNASAGKQIAIKNTFCLDGAASSGAEIFPTFRNTIAGETLQLAVELARDYTLPLEDMLSLLITGDIPKSRPIRAQLSNRPVYRLDGEPDYYAHGPITMEIEPWVPRNSVASYYEELQKFIFVHGPYLPSKKKLNLFNFVEERKEVLPSRQSGWGTLLNLWLSESGNLFSSRENFRLAYQRIRSKLLPENRHASAILLHRPLKSPKKGKWKISADDPN